MGRKRSSGRTLKTDQICAVLTPAAKFALDQRIRELDVNLSRSEFLERLGAGEGLEVVRFNLVFFGIHVLIES
jgi:hypothetical protein